MSQPLSADELCLIDAYWRAANYLSAAMIYLQENPLLREPLKPEHIKPRLLGHFGTSPGLTLVYAHLNRLIQKTNADVIYLAGPGHGGPAVVANVYLEGTFSEIYPETPEDEQGMQRLFRMFSSPGGFPSHVAAQIPGSIHEGGELGYSLLHAFGAVMDNPDLIAACVVGDGEAETGSLEGSWKSIDFLNPARDGAVLPILHLNGYKIAGPTVLARYSDEQLTQLFGGHGYCVHIVTGDDPPQVHQAFAAVLDTCYEQIRAIQRDARDRGVSERPEWPMIILRTPKGWTGPKTVDGKQVEGTFRSHQVPLANVRSNADHLRQLEEWFRSYRSEELFDERGRLIPELRALAPTGPKRMSAQPYANGGVLMQPLKLPNCQKYAVAVPSPGSVIAEATREMGKMLRDVFTLNEKEQNFRIFCPDETNSNRLNAVFEVTNRCWMLPTLPGDDHLAPDGRVLEVLSEHCCQGWLEGYLLTGRHGVFPCYEAFTPIVDSMLNQHAKWLKVCNELPWRKAIPSLNYLLTSHAWRQDHNGYSHQGPGFIDNVISKKASVARVYLPPDANTLLCVTEHCLKSKNYVNLIIAGKQPSLQWLSLDEAREHCARGASVWEWAGSTGDEEPDVILACAGDIPTTETLAAAWLLRQELPDLRLRVVNVVDLMALPTPDVHPHGLTPVSFADLFTTDRPVVFAFHGYPRVIHELIHGRPEAERFHVRGYIEEGTTTTPFDMCVLNEISRYHLAAEAIRRVERVRLKADSARQSFDDALVRHRQYIVQHLVDLPEIENWTWSQG